MGQALGLAEHPPPPYPRGGVEAPTDLSACLRQRTQSPSPVCSVAAHNHGMKTSWKIQVGVSPWSRPKENVSWTSKKEDHSLTLRDGLGQNSRTGTFSCHLCSSTSVLLLILMPSKPPTQASLGLDRCYSENILSSFHLLETVQAMEAHWMD